MCGSTDGDGRFGRSTRQSSHKWRGKYKLPACRLWGRSIGCGKAGIPLPVCFQLGRGCFLGGAWPGAMSVATARGCIQKLRPGAVTWCGHLGRCRCALHLLPSAPRRRAGRARSGRCGWCCRVPLAARKPAPRDGRPSHPSTRETAIEPPPRGRTGGLPGAKRIRVPGGTVFALAIDWKFWLRG